MAIANIQRDLKFLIENNTQLQNHLRDKSGTTDFHQIEITADESANAFQKGTQSMLIKVGYKAGDLVQITKAHNNVSQWKTIIAQMYTQLSGGTSVQKYGFSNLISIDKLATKNRVLLGRGVYLLAGRSNSRRLVVRLFNVKKKQKSNNLDDVTLTGFSSAFRDYAYDMWKDSLPASVQGKSSPDGKSLSTTKRKGYGRGASQSFGLRTPFVHSAGNEIGTHVLDSLKKDLDMYQQGPEFHLAGVDGAYYDVIQILIDELELKFEEKIIPTSDGGIKSARFIKGKIGGVNFAGSSPGDIKNISKRLMEILGDYLDTNADRFGFDEETGIDYDMSKTIRNKIKENARAKIVEDAKKKFKKKLSNRKTVIKEKSKKLKKQERTAPIKNSSKKKPRAIRAAIMAKSVGGKKRKEEAKQQNTSGLFKLRAIIQKRLPAEVRRNMGRPALINRTSTFSNSAELVGLRQTKMGLSGEYTYKLNPYATFESLGARQWPAGYNPKPLIAKSIRNLAIQYTGQKLVSLRRI